MSGIQGHDRIRDREPLGSEAGFALIEVMVSAVLLIVLSLSTLMVLDRASQASSMNRSRSVASGLAQADQESMRQLPITSLAGGYHPAPTIKTIGVIAYTITSSADWTRDATGLVTCSTNTGRAEYLRIKSSVTWKAMGSTQPIVAEGIVTPGVAALGANKGALAVLLTKADGTGTPGITVTAQGVSAVTDATGCAVLANLDSGSQTLTYSTPGYVDKDGTTDISKAVSIGNGTTAQEAGAYDRAGQIDAKLTDDGGTPVNWPTVFFSHTQRSPAIFTQTLSASATAVSSPALFPFPSAYTVYAGNCAGNDPTAYLSTYTGSSVQVPPGTTQPAPLTLQRFRVTVKSGGSAVSGATVMVAPASDPKMTGCTEAIGRARYSTNSSGWVDVPVPFGVWKVCADVWRSGSGASARYSQQKTLAGGVTTDDPIINSPAATTGTYAPKLTTLLDTVPASYNVTGTPTC